MVYWKRVLEWEKSNALGLDDVILIERLEFVFNQCLMTLRHYPMIWIDCIDTLKLKGKSVDAFIQRAIEANPHTYSYQTHPLIPRISLVFYSVEHFMETQPFTEVTVQFEQLVTRLETKIERLTNAYEKEKELMSAQWVTNTSLDGEQRQENRQIDKQHAQELHLIEQTKKTQLNIWAKALTVVYIVHMRLARRQVTN